MSEIDNTSKLAEEVVSECYVDLAEYTARTRSFPGLFDGMKTVYRRVIYQSRKYNNKVKSATIVGEALKLHPHGDDPVYSVLVEMTCPYGRFPLFDGKGNFGGLGFSSAASRYTEARLSDLARLMYLDLVDYAEFEEGETGYNEPKYLPALIPYCFLAGSQGMSVGLPTTNIPPLNPMDLVNFYIDYLEGNELHYPAPDFGGVIMDCDKIEHSDEMLRTGYGKLWFQPIIIREDYNKYVITRETPNSSFDKVLKKLKRYIDDEIVDHIDETDQHGYRHVFITNNTNKLSPDDLEKLINKALYCSMTYRIIVENDSKVYCCNFDYIVNNQIRYLRECVGRKYDDYIDKVTTKIIILKAIQSVRENESIMSNIHSLSSDELEDKIVDFGYEKWVAKEVLKKPISYLTKSHDSEIDELNKEYESYKEYRDNPDKYLLELYYKLKSEITNMYQSKSHSVFISDLERSADNRCSLSESRTELVFGNDKSVNWKNGLVAVSMLGSVSYSMISKVNASPILLPDLDESDYYVNVVGDFGKYIIIITANNYINVIPMSKIKLGLRNYTKSWGFDYPVTSVISTENDSVEFTDSKGNKIDVVCEDWVKSRISYPSKVSRYPIVKYKDGDVIVSINS